MDINYSIMSSMTTMPGCSPSGTLSRACGVTLPPAASGLGRKQLLVNYPSAFGLASGMQALDENGNQVTGTAVSYDANGNLLSSGVQTNPGQSPVQYTDQPRRATTAKGALLRSPVRRAMPPVIVTARSPAS